MRVKSNKSKYMIAFIMLGFFAALFLPVNLEKSEIILGDNPTVVANDLSTQQPEDGLWVEYIMYHLDSGVLQDNDTVWMRFKFNFINGSHYNVSVLQLSHDNLTVFNGWYVVNNSTLIVEQDGTTWNLVDQFDPGIIPGNQLLGAIIPNRSVMGPSENFNVTGTGTHPTLGETVILTGMGNTTSSIQYLNASGLLVDGYTTNGTHQSYLHLVRTNIANLSYTPSFVPIDEARDTWLKIDIVKKNKTSGLYSAGITENVTITPLGPTQFNSTVNMLGRMGPNSSWTQMEFNMTIDTIDTPMMAGPGAPDPFNTTDSSMGLDFIFIDLSQTYTGQIIGTSVPNFGSNGSVVYPATVVGTEIFRGRNCTKLVALPSSDINATTWVDTATGLTLRQFIDNWDEEIILELVCSNWFDPGYSLNTPPVNSWMEMAGFFIFNDTSMNGTNGTIKKAPTYIRSEITVIDSRYLTISQLLMRHEDYDNNSVSDRFETQNGTAVLDSQTAMLWNATENSSMGMQGNSTIYGTNSNFSGFFMFSLYPGLALDTLFIQSYGPALAVGRIANTNVIKDGIPCTEVNISSEYYVDENRTETHDGAMYYENSNGIFYEIDGYYNGTQSMLLKRINGNVTGTPALAIAPANNGMAYTEGFGARAGYGGDLPRYNSFVQKMDVEDLGSQMYNLTIQHTEMKPDDGNVSIMTGTMTVDNSRRWITDGGGMWYGSPNATVFGFSMVNIPDPALLNIGDWIPISVGPAPLIIGEVAGYDVVNGINVLRVAPAPEVHPGINADLYFDDVNGFLVQMNWSMNWENTLFRVQMQNFTGGAITPSGINDGYWEEMNGYTQTTNLTNASDIWLDPWIVYSDITDNTDGTFNLTSDGQFGGGNSTRMQFAERIDAVTMEVVESTHPLILSSSFNFSGYYGHTNAQIRDNVQLGSICLINIGDRLDLPYEVTGMDTYHNRSVYTLTLHPYFTSIFNSSSNCSIASDLWYFESNGMLAKMWFNDTTKNGSIEYEWLLEGNMVYDSLDSDPLPMLNETWAELILVTNETGVWSDRMPIGYEAWSTGGNNYTSQFMMRQTEEENGTHVEFWNYWRFDTDNQKRFVHALQMENLSVLYEKTGWNKTWDGAPDPADQVLIDFARCPNTLELGDLLYTTLPGDDGQQVLRVMAISSQFYSRIVGTRTSIILEPIDNDGVRIHYDQITGMMLKLEMEHQNWNGTADVIVNETATIVNTNLLDSNQKIAWSAGTNLEYNGTMYEVRNYNWSDVHINEMNLSMTVLSDGLPSLVRVDIEQSSDGGPWMSSWMELNYRQNRMLWLDSMDPAMASGSWPNETGSPMTLNAFNLYPDVALGDQYIIMFGPWWDVVEVVDTSYTHASGIECIYLESLDANQTVQAWYVKSNGTLVELFMGQYKEYWWGNESRLMMLHFSWSIIGGDTEIQDIPGFPVPVICLMLIGVVAVLIKTTKYHRKRE
ncbi:MAG: hypothetical protein ACFFCS_15835 [Candidatus Hodarchaeota archaeon]